MMRRFESLDVLAPDVGLTVRRHSAFKTWIGATLSIIGFLGIFFYLALSVYDYFSRDVKSVSTMTVFNKEQTPYDLLKNKNIPIIMIATPSAYLNKDEVTKYVTLKLDIAFNSAAGQPYQKTTVDFVPCAELIASGKVEHFKIEDSVANERIKRDGFCIDPKDNHIIASGRGYEVGARLATIRIMPCSLSSGCVPSSDVTSMYVFVGKIEPTINYNDYSTPVSYKLTTDHMLSVSLAMGQYYTERLMLVNIKDYIGFPFNEELVKSFTVTDKVIFNNWERDGSSSCTTQDVSDGLCLDYLTWDIISGSNLQTNTRYYTSLRIIVAELGGLKTAIFFVLFWVYFAYNKSRLNDHLVRAVYNLRRKPRNIWYFLKCCPKRNQHDGEIHAAHTDKDGVIIASDTVFDQAVKVIMRSLDMSIVAKDLNTLKFIIHFLMSEYQRTLVPIVTLNVDLNMQRERKNEHTIRFNSSDKLDKQPLVPATANDSFDEADVLGQKNFDLTMSNPNLIRSKGGRKEQIMKVSYETLMKRFNEEGIQNISPEELADLGFKKEICIDMDKVFYNVLGKASYLPFRESNDFCPRIIGKGVNSVNLKDHRNDSENPTLGQNKKNPNTATHDQRNTKPSPSNKVANASQLSNNSRTPSHKENSKKHPSFDFQDKNELKESNDWKDLEKGHSDKHGKEGAHGKDEKYGEKDRHGKDDKKFKKIIDRGEENEPFNAKYSSTQNKPHSPVKKPNY
jgi:hypothetical protein